jgi:hypothetical protein
MAELVRPQKAALEAGSIELAVEKYGAGGDCAIPARAAAAKAKCLHRIPQSVESCYHNLVGTRDARGCAWRHDFSRDRRKLFERVGCQDGEAVCYVGHQLVDVCVAQPLRRRGVLHVAA